MSLLCHRGVGKVSEGKRKNSCWFSSLCAKHELGSFLESPREKKKNYSMQQILLFQWYRRILQVIKLYFAQGHKNIWQRWNLNPDLFISGVLRWRVVLVALVCPSFGSESLESRHTGTVGFWVLKYTKNQSYWPACLPPFFLLLLSC